MPTLTTRLTSISLKRLTVLATVAALGLLAATPAQAEQRRRVVLERSTLKGHGLYAEWSYQEGDVLTFVALVASSEKSRTKADGRQQFDVASLNITRANTVTGNVDIAGAAYTEIFDLDVNANLGKARFRADVIFQDDNSFTFFDLHIDLKFDATGPTTTLRDHTIDVSEPGLIIKARFNGKFRDAVATGTVFGTPRADGGLGWLREPHEFTPIPSTGGQIQKNKHANITIATSWQQ